MDLIVTHIMLHVVVLIVAFSYCYAECHYAECHYAECRYAECRGGQRIHVTI